MSLADRIARWPVLNWWLEIAFVLVLIGAAAAISVGTRRRIESQIPPCVAVRDVPAGALSDNPLRYP